MASAQLLPPNPGHKRIFECPQRASWLRAVIDPAEVCVHIHNMTGQMLVVYWPGALTLRANASENVPDEYVLPEQYNHSLRPTRRSCARLLQLDLL